MIIEEIMINNWRNYREPHTFRFDKGLNLLIGRNGAGKSTLLEAFTRVFHDRFNSKPEDIKRMQPLDSTLGPEASIVFNANGRRYRIVKRFLNQPVSQLYLERDGKWELDHQSDEADARLRELFNGEATSKQSAKPEHRGVAQALWYLQRDNPLPEGNWAAGVQEGLKGLFPQIIRSPEEERILIALQEEYSQYFTPKGKEQSSSELSSLKDELPKLEGRIGDLRATIESAEQFRSELAEAGRDAEEKRTLLEEGKRQLAEMRAAAEESNRLMLEKERKERELKEAEKAHADLLSTKNQLDSRKKRIATLQEELDRQSRQLLEVEREIRSERDSASDHHSRWKDTLEPELRNVEDRLNALHAMGQIRALEAEAERLEAITKQIRLAEKELKSKKEQQHKTLCPSKKEVAAYREALAGMSRIEGQIEISGIKVGFHLVNPKTGILASPNPKSSRDGEFVIIGPTDFKIKGVGTISVRGGGASLAELNEQIETVVKKKRDIETRFKVDSLEDLIVLQQNALVLIREIKKLESGLNDLRRGEKDPEAKLAKLCGELEQSRERVKGLPARDALELKESIRLAEREKRDIIANIDLEQKKEEKAHQNIQKSVGVQSGVMKKLADIGAEVRTLSEQDKAVFEVYGSTDNLDSCIGRARETTERAKMAYEEILKDYELRVEAPIRLYQQAEKRVTALQEQLEALGKTVAGRQARIEQICADNTYTELADLEACLVSRKRRLASLERRANAVRLLTDIVSEYQKEQASVLAGPVAEIVNRWLSILTEGSLERVELDENLIPRSTKSRHYEEALPMESLSFGTYEQIVVLLRLAIGVLVSKEEPNLVVVDDRLVNADNDRMNRLGLVLEEAAKSCQIILATCRDTPYAGISTTIIRVPQDGKASS